MSIQGSWSRAKKNQDGATDSAASPVLSDPTRARLEPWCRQQAGGRRGPGKPRSPAHAVDPLGPGVTETELAQATIERAAPDGGWSGHPLRELE